MCGIVGLHLRSADLEPQLGGLLTEMLVAMTDRGPDSAGVAVYQGAASDGRHRYSLHSSDGHIDWASIAQSIEDQLNVDIRARKVADAAVLVTSADPDVFFPVLKEHVRDVSVFSQGRVVEVFKDVGSPAEICSRYGIPSRG